MMLTMEDVAFKLDVSYQRYQQYESDKVQLIHPIFFKILGVLEIDLLEYIKETTKFNLKPQNIVSESEVNYLNISMKQLIKELRERDELIGALKYQINQLKNQLP